jgi:hypothetical protein
MGKYVPKATKTHATIELLLKTVFSTWTLQRGYKEDTRGDPVELRVEFCKGGSEEMAL